MVRNTAAVHPRLQGDNVLGLIISAIIVGLTSGAGPTGASRPPGHPHLAHHPNRIGIVAALIGSLIASALGVGETRGIDWIKLIIQVALAAAGVAPFVGRDAPERRGL